MHLFDKKTSINHLLLFQPTQNRFQYQSKTTRGGTWGGVGRQLLHSCINFLGLQSTYLPADKIFDLWVLVLRFLSSWFFKTSFFRDCGMSPSACCCCWRQSSWLSFLSRRKIGSWRTTFCSRYSRWRQSSWVGRSPYQEGSQLSFQLTLQTLCCFCC